MHMFQKRPGRDVMVMDETGKRCAVVPPIAATQIVGGRFGQIQIAHDPIGHFDLDLIKKPRRGRVKRVVQIKDPGADMAKGLRRHDVHLARRGARGNVDPLIGGAHVA